MGKRRNGNGIIDRRYDEDGKRTSYKDKPGAKPFRVYCHYGDKQYSKSFPTYKEAEDWKRDQDEQDRNKDNIGYIKRRDTEALRDIKVRELVRRHIQEINRKRGKPDSELDVLDTPDLVRLNRFCATGLAGRSLADVSGQKHYFIRYFADRLTTPWEGNGWSNPKHLTTRAVARERNILQRAFEVAIQENWWDVCHALVNPVRGIHIEGSKHDRNRMVMDGELKKLELECAKLRGDNKYYLPVAIYLAIETGMRADELFNLLWNDVNLDKRRVRIRRSKIDRKLRERGLRPGRTIVLPFMSTVILKNRRSELIESSLYNGDDHIFPKKPNPDKPHPLLQVFERVVQRAKLEAHDGETLIFRDLRRTANEGFYMARLSKEQRMLMRGELDSGMDPVYRSSIALENELRPIQALLDQHHLGGTAKELAAKGYNIEQLEEYLAADIGNPPTFDRLAKQISVNKPLADERENGMNDSVIVFRSNGEPGGIDWIGEKLKGEAAALLNVPLDELIRIDGNADTDEGWGGTLYGQNNYIAVSKKHLDTFMKELSVTQRLAAIHKRHGTSVITR